MKKPHGDSRANSFFMVNRVHPRRDIAEMASRTRLREPREHSSPSPVVQGRRSRNRACGYLPAEDAGSEEAAGRLPGEFILHGESCSPAT